MSTQNQNMKEEFKINWKGIVKYTVITGLIAGAYYYGKKKGAAQEAAKHAVSETVETAAVEAAEI